MADEAKWYVVHTYSGYENKVATNIEKIVENRKMHDLILEVKVPTEIVTEIKDEQKKEVERKIFPGYVMVKVAVFEDEETGVGLEFPAENYDGKVEIEVTYRTEEFNGKDWVNTNDDKVASYEVSVGTEYNAVREFFVKIANFFLNTLPNLILGFMGSSK